MKATLKLLAIARDKKNTKKRKKNENKITVKQQQ